MLSNYKLDALIRAGVSRLHEQLMVLDSRTWPPDLEEGTDAPSSPDFIDHDLSRWEDEGGRAA